MTPTPELNPAPPEPLPDEAVIAWASSSSRTSPQAALRLSRPSMIPVTLGSSGIKKWS